MLKYPVPL